LFYSEEGKKALLVFTVYFLYPCNIKYNNIFTQVKYVCLMSNVPSAVTTAGLLGKGHSDYLPPVVQHLDKVIHQGPVPRKLDNFILG